MFFSKLNLLIKLELFTEKEFSLFDIESMFSEEVTINSQKIKNGMQ